MATKKKTWDELAPVTRANRFAVIAANHLPRTDRFVVPMTTVHARCGDGGNCTGPGCRITR